MWMEGAFSESRSPHRKVHSPSPCTTPKLQRSPTASLYPIARDLSTLEKLRSYYHREFRLLQLLNICPTSPKYPRPFSLPPPDTRTSQLTMTGRGGGGGGRKTLLAPIHFIFKLLQQRSLVSIWLYEQMAIRIEGKIRVRDATNPHFHDEANIYKGI
jgi:hypothetical protein